MSLAVFKAKVNNQKCQSSCIMPSNITGFHSPSGVVGGNQGATLPQRSDMACSNGCNNPQFDRTLFRTGPKTTNASLALHQRRMACRPIFKLNQREQQMRTDTLATKCSKTYVATEERKKNVFVCNAPAQTSIRIDFLKSGCRTTQNLDTMSQGMYILKQVNNRSCLTSTLDPSKIAYFGRC